MRDVPKVVGWEAGLGFCSLGPYTAPSKGAIEGISHPGSVSLGCLMFLVSELRVEESGSCTCPIL